MTSAATPCGQISEVQRRNRRLYKKCGPRHRLWTHDDKISNSLMPKFISQSQIENPVKCMKILDFAEKMAE